MHDYYRKYQRVYKLAATKICRASEDKLTWQQIDVNTVFDNPAKLSYTVLKPAEKNAAAAYRYSQFMLSV